MDLLLIALLVAIVFGLLGGYIAGQKGREPVEGVLLGFLFGPIGAVVVALLPTRAKPRRSHSTRVRSHGTPEYRDDWDAPPPARQSDPVEDQVVDFLRESGGQPREQLDMDAIARAARTPRNQGQG
jgi:uncharacterized membrane protein YeaQ/YmgE (transglycosylase-associated protein family)